MTRQGSRIYINWKEMESGRRNSGRMLRTRLNGDGNDLFANLVEERILQESMK